MVGRPARRPDRTTTVNSGRRRRRACAGSTSGGELVATLATAGGEDAAPGPGAQPEPEAVGLGPATVVRLERALAHEGLLLLTTSVRRGPGRAPHARGRAGRRPAVSRPRDRHPYPRLVCRAREPGDTPRRGPHRLLCTDSDQHSRAAGRTAAG